MKQLVPRIALKGDVYERSEPSPWVEPRNDGTDDQRPTNDQNGNYLSLFKTAPVDDQKLTDIQ